MDSAKLKGFQVYFQNRREFRQLAKEIFKEHCYYLELDTSHPYIIDAGAHIGLATLYFKSIFPKSYILSVEPLPQNLSLLEKNLFENQIKNVDVLPVALAPQSGEVILNIDDSSSNWHSTASLYQGAWNRSQSTQEVLVSAVTLNSLLTKPVDILKLDIEAAEVDVIVSAGDRLREVKNLFIEHHPRDFRPISPLLDHLASLGFSYEIYKNGLQVSPTQAKGLVLVQATRQS